MPEFSYFAFIHGMISQSCGDVEKDGASLAAQCIDTLSGLDTPEQFPPKLLILFASSALLGETVGERTARAAQLLAGVQQGFRNWHGEEVPLIGCSTAAVFCRPSDGESRVHERGALLVCLASRLIDAKVAVGRDARDRPEAAIRQIFEQLQLDPQGETDPNPLADRMLFTMFPGYGTSGAVSTYPAPDLHRMLRQGTRARIRIAGAVASTGRPFQGVSDLQFAGKVVMTDAVVIANVTTGVPIGTRLAHGLTSTGHILQVRKLCPNGRCIEAFDQGKPMNVLRRAGEHALLGRLSASSEPIIIVPRAGADGQRLELFREVRENDVFEILQPEPQKIQKAAVDSVSQARQRIPVQRPTGNLMLIGNQWRLRYALAGLDIEQTLREVEGVLPGAPSVGGFFDGQIGQDESGRSQFNNGSFVSIVFGDEMRERTPLHRGFKYLASSETRMTEVSSLDKTISKALEIVFGAGFPGAMLSLVFQNEKQEHIIAQKAIGSRFRKIVDETRRPLNDDDILSKVAQERQAVFIRNSRIHPYCNPEAVQRSGIVSQYVIPLMNLHGKVVGVLQVDLGKVERLPVPEKEVLDSLGSIIGASINRLLNYSEALIARALDPALSEALAAKTIEEGLQSLVVAACEAFEVETGLVRLADLRKEQLVMLAGRGPCFDAATNSRRVANFDDVTPICQAYRNGGVTIINSATQDFAYREMRRNFANDEALMAALDGIGSYVTVAFENESQIKLGALCLISSQEWYFTSSHMKALQALGRKVGFLVEHFRRKESENAAQHRVRFILNSGMRLAEVQNLNDIDGELTHAIHRFCREAGAELGSLYIWDEDRRNYILRAQYGWTDPRWVNAARYGKDDLWAGASAINGMPVYIPDFHRHYRDHGYPERYLREAFGIPPSREHVVEGIGIPLFIGENQTGILTMYRRRTEEESGFAVLRNPYYADQWQALIQETASDVAALAFVLQSRQRAQWESEEFRRRQLVHSAINLPHSSASIEYRICEMALKAYKAVRVDFYKVEDLGGKKKLFWVDGLLRDPRNKSISNADSLPSHREELAVSALREREIKIERLQISEQDRYANPRVAATEGLVHRACIPLFAGATRPLGVLDLQWRIGLKQALTPIVLHDELELRLLGNVVSSGYLRHLSKLDAEQKHLATEAAAAYSFQQSHRLGNVMQRITFLGQRLALVEAEGRSEVIQELQAAIVDANQKTQRVMGLGSMVREQFREECSLSWLLDNWMSEVGKERERVIRERGIQLSNGVPRDVQVYVDISLTKEAFVNLINNAIQAIEKKGGTGAPAFGDRLTISAVVAKNQRQVEVALRDTGIGMNEETKKNALRGFFGTQGHRGVGVLISRVLLTSQGGDLRYESIPGEGSTAFVTLPLAYRGDKPRLIAPL
ncbi:MAG: GAF domain-containing protein [Blastocatellia bacterium]|nr:GAF domain-containing protein [Blastocatellia bacterium]